jgi:predicted AAA+ superfamily ATPase
MSSIKRYLHLELPLGQSCFLFGARKTGKSTLLKEQYADHALYIDLLSASTYQAFLQRPSRLEEEMNANPDKSLIIIDEVQKIPLLLDEVHRLIELYKNKQFILCGSSSKRLKATGANLLGGRAWRFLLVPFCYPEIRTLDWQKICNQGLVPSHYLATSSVERSLAAYLYEYVLPEVQFEANIRKKDHFARFLDVMALSHGELINYSNIARDCGIDSKTVRSYFEILEDMYLGYMIYPYQSVTKRQLIQQHPKFYFFDTGLTNYLRRYHLLEMVGPEAGRSFEHYVLLELMAYKYLNEKRDTICFWRTKEAYEVDFVVADLAIEVKISTPIEKSHLKGLITFAKEGHNHHLHMVSLEPRKRLMNIENKEITIWPIQEFLEALWAKTLW